MPRPLHSSLFLTLTILPSFLLLPFVSSSKLHLFPYSQGDIYGTLHICTLDTDSYTVLNDTYLLHTPACHNNCPLFVSSYDPYHDLIYLNIIDESAGSSFFTIDNKFSTVSLKSPPPQSPILKLAFTNSTGLLLVQNNNLLQVNYWDSSSNDTNRLNNIKASFSTEVGSFSPFVSLFSNIGTPTLYALDRDSSSLLVWQYLNTATATLIPLGAPANPVWVNTITDLAYVPSLAALVAVDRFGRLWDIDVRDGSLYQLSGNVWQAQSVLSGRTQMVLKVEEGALVAYMVGWDTVNYALARVEVFVGQVQKKQIQGTMAGWQYLAMTN